MFRWIYNWFTASPWFSVEQGNSVVVGERGYYGTLTLSARDDVYSITVKLDSEQADELMRWLQSTRGSVNKGKKNNVIRINSKK